MVASRERGGLFFDEAWGDERVRLHSECVIEACLALCSNTDLDPDVFVIAGWVHDLGRKVDKGSHHLVSLRFLDGFLEENPGFAYLRDDVEDCIRNHRSGGTPETLYGRVFQCADKVALRDKRWLAYERSSG